MDRNDERTRKFNEAIVNMLYPPPDPQPEEELKPVQALAENFGSDDIPDTLDDHGNASTSGDEEQEGEPQKLTRAQRKKIRKKKLKEEAICRGKLIGPLLPTKTDQCADPDVKDPPAVRSNASERKENSRADEPGAARSKKVNQRRKAKRMAKIKRNSSNSENCNQQSTSNPSADIGTTQ